MLETGKPIFADQWQGPRAGLLDRDPADLHAKRHVIDHRTPWQKQILLQHVTNLADIAGGILLIDQDAAGGGSLKARNDVEDSALAAAGRHDRVTKRPAGTERSTGESAVKVCPPVWKVIDKLSSRNFGRMEPANFASIRPTGATGLPMKS